MFLKDTLNTRRYEGQSGSFGAGQSQRPGAPVSLIVFDTGRCFASFRMIQRDRSSSSRKRKVRCTNQGVGLGSRADFKEDTRTHTRIARVPCSRSVNKGVVIPTQ